MHRLCHAPLGIVLYCEINGGNKSRAKKWSCIKSNLCGRFGNIICLNELFIIQYFFQVIINILFFFTFFMCGMLILCFQKGFDILREIVPALENCSSKESKSSMLFKCRYTIFVNKYFFNLRCFLLFIVLVEIVFVYW